MHFQAGFDVFVCSANDISVIDEKWQIFKQVNCCHMSARLRILSHNHAEDESSLTLVDECMYIRVYRQ